jgi:multimeric flavodoxin WrbA
MTRALFLSCTLKSSPKPSNTEALADVLVKVMQADGVETEVVRLVDLNIKPGVESDEGEDDDWPAVRRKIIEADILVMVTPTWLGQASSVCHRALERMDAMISETGRDGLPVAYGKVAGIVITGNEDGAHHIVATVGQALIDIGFTLPGWCWTYWHLGPGAGPDYLEASQGHKYADTVGRNAARNLMAVSGALQAIKLPKPEAAQ